MTQKTEVVVVGGGYAGVMAANRLTRRDDVDVTLVNSRPQPTSASGCPSRC